MKRTLALVLALIMILCMIPASMLTAFARGRGVYMNDVTNQTIENAPGQYIPETVVIDGVLDDTGWREDDWKRVNSESGTWNVQYPTKNETINNETFAYKYNVRKDYYYLYGAFVVPTNEAGLVKLWLNNDAKGRNSCSHVFTFDITGKVSGGVAAYSGNGTWKRETADGVAVEDKSTYYFEKSKVVFQADGEFTNIEFKVLLADFCPAANPSIDYFVSVDTKTPVESDPNGDYEALYHPAIEIEETFNRDEWFPGMNGNWKSQFAGEITTEDLNGLGEHSFKGDIDINGEFDEAEWAQHTDFYSRWYERTNVTDYKDNVNFMKPYSDLVYNKSLWNATSNWSAEHDLRVTANYIHGAALISVPANTTTNNIRFNMFQVVNENTIWQTTVYLHSSTGNYIDAAQFTFYENGVPVVSYSAESGDIHAEGYFNCNRNLIINNETVGVTVFSGGTRVVGSPGLYSFEFRIDRRFAHNFAPTVYDFCMAPDDTSRYWSCDNRYDGSTTTGDGNEQHPGYTKEAANLKQAYYPITHFNNQFGLDEIGASDAEVEYYEPYTLYTPDGYLGVKAWPGLTFSAGGPNNADFVNSGNSDRLRNLNYLHSLRSDYEFVYGALSVQAEADSPFKNWKLGTETSPNGGDYFTLWVMVPDETGTRYRFDIWAYENPNYDPNDSTTGPQYFAQIAGVDGNGNYVIEPETGAKAAFVNRENSADKDRYYAIEYKIALSSVQAKLNIGIDTTEQIADYLSTPIFEYYTSLSVANDDKTAYASMLWPRSGNGNLLPDDVGFLWNKEVNSNGIYGNPQALRYQDVIRVVEPDGRIVEELRFDLDDVNFSDSEYRDISKYSNFFTAKEEFYVGRDYAYLGAEIDGDVSSYNTKVILWIKTEDGTIHNYEFGHNGANATMKYDGNVVSDTTYVDQYGMTSTNGKTYFEAILDMDRFGSGEGFEYYIEIQQRVNGENLNRVFSDGTKKITLPTIDYGSQINTVKSWYQNAGSVEDLIHFPREEITIDGNLNDNGWDNGEWVYVSTDINANLQEADTHKDAFKTDFYYQLRVDDEYLYVAAVIFYSDCTYAANQTNITASEPGFRIWLKSGREGQNVLNGDSRTYTDYYGMYINKSGEIVFGSKKNTMPTYPNNTRNLYNKYYAPVVPLRDADGKLVYENGKVKYTYHAEGLGTAYTRFDGDTVYPSDLFGYTQYIINEQEANKNVNETEVLKGETINPEDYEKEGMLAGSNENVEQGIMRFGGDANYSQEFDHGRIETLGNDSTVVEFKVKLDEFGGHDEFQYIVTASSNTLWGGTRSTMYPAITSEAGSRDNYFHYYYPYWHWVDDTSVTVTEEVRADMTLLTYKRPVITLGAKVSKTYMYQGKETNALRMGGLWEEKYIRKTKELAENNGYWPDKSGDPNWVDYWDLKAMGMVVIPTYLLKENTNITSERPGKYDLFKGTKNSVWMDADGIVKWQGDLDDGDERNNYADYKNFAFYVTVVNVPTNVNFCFRGFADYYDEVLDACPSYYDVVLERSIDMVIDSAIRTEDNNKEEEDNALPPGEFSRDDESGFTGTDGSDYENSIDPSEDVSDDVSDDTSVAPGITTEENGASLDIAWPSHFHQNNSNQKYSNSLVFADSAGTGFSVGGFYAVTDSDGNTTTFPNTQLAYWKKLYFTQNADGTLTLQNIEGSGGTGYASWQINSGVMVVAYHPDDHPNRAVFDSYKVGETFVIEGKTLDQIGGTSPDTELKATLKRVIVCNHTSGWNPATCVKPETCKDCGAARPGSYPLGHKYDEDAKQTCTEGIKCTVCGFEKSPALGHTNGAGVWTYDDATHWWTCTREGCPEPNVKRNEAAHTFKNGKCSVCGYACEHPYGEGNFHEAVDATCGVSGNIAYYECECGLKFTDANCTTPVADVIIPALEHDYDEETGICNNCGDELTPTVVGQLEHAYPGKYFENGNGGYYTMVFSDSTNAPHSLRGWTPYTGDKGYSANSNYFPMPNADETGGDLAWWYKISLRKISTVDGREYFVVQAICKPATYTDETNTTISVDLSYLADLSALTAEEKANHPWYIDEDTMVVAVPSSSEYWDEIAELVEGDVVYISGDTAYTFAQTGSTAADTLLTDANGQFGTYLTLHKHKWVAATCTEPKHCRECGEQDPEDTALGHTLGAEATCTTAQLCTTCHAVIVPALGHNYDNYVTEDAATCTTNETETGKCTRCDATDTRDIENTKLGHEFKTYVSNNNAICGKDGTKTAKCERCDVTDTIVDEGTALEHSFTNYVYDDNATCTENGTETAHCDRNCGASDTRVVENTATGHSFTHYVFDNNATCTEDGTETATCDYYGCGETHTRTKAGSALGHEMSSEWTTDATYHWHVCTRCDYVFEDSKAEHTFVDGFCSVCERAQFNPIKLDIAFPTTDPGDQTIVFCAPSSLGNFQLKGFYENEDTDVLYPDTGSLDGWHIILLDRVDGETTGDGQWEVVAVDATGTQYYTDTTTWKIGLLDSGEYRMAIAVPPAKIDESVTMLEIGDLVNWVTPDGGTDYDAAANADEDEAVNAYLDLDCVHSWIDADCDTPKTCKLCGATRGDALGHDWIDADCDTPKTCDRCGETEGDALGHDWVDADCDTPKTCDRCGETEGEALGHSWVDATCTAPKHCTVCGETEGEALPHTPGTAADCENDQTCTVCGTILANKLGHTPGAAATCTTAQTCTVCGEVIKAALGHTPGDPATCTTEQTCTVCGQVVVEALGHTPGAAATCTTDQICTVCGEVLVAALGHTWGENPEDGAQCTRCGETYVAFVPVQIPLTYANTDGSSTDIMVYAAAAHTKITGSSNNYQYWHMALLEYDDVSGKFRVVEVDPSGTTKYTSWYYGYDRIIIASWADNSNTTISTLKVDDYLELTGTTLETLKSESGSISATLTTVNYKGSGEITAPQVLTPIIKEPTYNKFVVAYVPLDDRPVHTSRVQLEAEASGITLLMPNAADYRTHLYNASLGEEGHGGNTANILAWLKEQEANGVDFYVVALDQVFSGGLVNSRYSDPDFDGQLTPEDQDAADFLVELAKNNYVVYTDTIMRLASTYPYKDHTEALYTMLRDYGQGKNYYGQSNRIVLDENGVDKYALTLEHVISSYRYSSDGTSPIGRYFQVGSSYYNLEDNVLNGYLGARERKLRITDYMLRNAGANINHYYIGMDDSAEGETIQKNEQRYIDMVIKKTGANAITFAGADEMSVMGISAITNYLVNTPEAEKIPAAEGWEVSKIPVNVVYFGDGANWQADTYDSGDLGPAIDLHLKALDAYQVDAEYANDPKVIQLVVVTRGTEQYSFSGTYTDIVAAQTQVAASKANADAAAAYIKAQLTAHKPVAIIDVTYWNAIHLNFVAEAMRNAGIFDMPEFTEILGYSTWNTAGNAIGLAMGQAFSRYNYIMNTDLVSKSSNVGFLKMLAYSFVKDAAYRTNSFITDANGYYWSMNTSSQKTYIVNDGTYNYTIYTTAGFTGNEFLGYVNKNNARILLKDGVSTEYYNHNISIHTPVWPANWGPRSFECWFTVEGTSDEPENGDIIVGDGVALPDEDFQ